MNKIILLQCAVLSLSTCIRPQAAYESLAPGIWRGVLTLNPEPKAPLKDEIERYEKEGTLPLRNIDDELPFLFEVFYDSSGHHPYFEIINGSERIKVEDVRVKRNRNTAEDTVWIDFPVFDTHIKGILKEGIVQGEWIVRNKLDYRIPFVAHYGKKYRFDVLPNAPVGNISGIWDCDFDLNTSKPTKAIGEFKQDGSKLTGTFRTETGDYRYLEGTVSGHKFYLSCFDGSHAFLFYGKIAGDSLVGTFRSGKHFTSLWTATKNEAAALTHPDLLTTASGSAVHFSFLDHTGKTKTLEDYKGKPKILQVMGTWCPNCYDETRFLTKYLAEHPHLEVEVIGLACERYKDTSQSLRAITIYKNKLQIPYDILLASTSHLNKVSALQLPFLDSIIAYPTMVFLDKENRILKIHTGFDGPATSKYQDFVNDFDKTIQLLLKKEK